jgi:hypothetical protein
VNATCSIDALVLLALACARAAEALRELGSATAQRPEPVRCHEH